MSVSPDRAAEDPAAPKRIGFITPSSNTALEPLTYQILESLRDRVCAHFTRLPVTRMSLDERDLSQFEVKGMVEAARLLADAPLDAVLWNGTSGSWMGFALDEEICRRITEATGLPASTSTLAQVEVLRALGLRRIGLAVPYVDDLTDRIVANYEAASFSVVSRANLGLTVNREVGAVSPNRVRQLLRDADSREAECLVVACTNLAGAPVVADMEMELRKPVFDSVIVTLWKGLDMVGVTPRIPGWGRLLSAGKDLMAIQSVLEELLERTNASRTTVRIDAPAHGLHVDLVAGEAVRPGVRSLRTESSLDQRSLATVRWIDAHRRTLVQDDCAVADPPPPQALLDVYGVRAQMLAPIVCGESMVGWVSVHQIGTVRRWSAADVASIEDAAARVRETVERAGWFA